MLKALYMLDGSGLMAQASISKHQASSRSNRAQKYGKQIGEVLLVLWLLILPEWLINDSGWIAIFVVDFGTSKMLTKHGPSDPLSITEIL